ncbi:hypothetical protein RF11_01229 [Thelohanellus kitauei]|uniref:Cyclic nucleotide-binding domain-containing protein n=1 Tax=Thelohanellus kitauei TaxID=669202 RepID=A0A0C2NC81_THEKT|nr:hypothetical protein RF11_01229 [Thelohanellus kitauei]
MLPTPAQEEIRNFTRDPISVQTPSFLPTRIIRIQTIESEFPKEYENIGIALKKIFLFESDALKIIFGSMHSRTIDKNEDIEGLYVIKSGSVELLYSDAVHSNLSLRIFEAAEPLKTSSESVYNLKAVALEASIIFLLKVF